jgi:photosystem II stability/assembly factor-like uncharacterized protein
VGGSDLIGVAKSVNGGIDWTPINQGLDHPYVFRIFISPENSSILYAGAEGGFYKSIDAGSSWQATSLGYTVLALAFDEKDPNILFAGTEGYGVLKSLNGGESWVEFNDGFESPYGRNYIKALITMSNPGNSLYAGTTVGLFARTIPSHVFIPLVNH